MVAGSTLLHSAAENDQVAAMQYLIGRGMDANETDDDGNTPLHVAIQNGCKVNGGNFGRTFYRGNFGHSLGNDAQCCALYIAHRSLASVRSYPRVQSYTHLPYVMLKTTCTHAYAHLAAEFDEKEGYQKSLAVLDQVVQKRKFGTLQQRVEQLAQDQAKQELQEMVEKLLEAQNQETQ